MGELGILRDMGDGLLGLWCPGCKRIHMINTDTDDRPTAPAWDFNGNYDRPTFNPSVKVWGVEELTDEEYERVLSGQLIEPRPFVCHSTVTDGNIFFHPDTTHALSGQTVSLEPAKV